MNDLLIAKPWAEIREVHRLEKNNTNELRIFCSQRGMPEDSFTFQIRTFKPTTEFGNGKNRNMIAQCTLHISEIEAILSWMKREP